MLEPRKRTALDGKVWWCVFDTDKMEWSTILFGKYNLKRDCQYAIDRWNIRKEELKAMNCQHEIKVVLENGESFYTKVSGTKEDIEKYYVGSVFNVGVVNDDMQKCVRVEFL